MLILCAIWLARLDKAGMYSVGPMHIYCDTPKELAFTSFSNNTAIACAEEVYKKCTGSNSHTSCLVVELLLFGLMAGIDKTSMTSCNRSTNNIADLLYLSIQALHIYRNLQEVHRPILLHISSCFILRALLTGILDGLD